MGILAATLFVLGLIAAVLLLILLPYIFLLGAIIFSFGVAGFFILFLFYIIFTDLLER